MNISMICAAINELPLRKQWPILRSIERPRGRGHLSAVFMAGLPAYVYGGLVRLLPASGWLAD
ncbi:MAG TPA: hypothetical protein PK874_13535 [Desulfobacteraceae bacterium]|nr:hypothetical protein [Desulfobacteraceae bacterium]HPJ69179.1 hypothetical protein [Desulfobacteraceae bacterium]